jgi:hypothetical protein
MTIQKLKEFYEKRPFKPFTIHMADGESMTVKHPEFLMLTAAGRTIYVHTGRDEEVQVIDLLLVTKLSTGAANGRHIRASRN